MCRLFGLTAAPNRVAATFWLIDAPDSLVQQSRREPDGVGLGVFEPDGSTIIHKRPIAAYEDMEYAREARELTGATFLAHVRYASTGELRDENTHPFDLDGRLFAHNGVIEGLDRLDEHLGEDRSPVRGDTDSERFFALITRETQASGGQIAAGIEHAVRWIARNLPVYALNLILITDQELWALRYPDTHELYVLERQAGGPHGDRHLEHSGTAGRMRVNSGDLADSPAVVIASERMDEHPQWRLMEPGELLHVGPDLRVTRRLLLPDPPSHKLTLDDLRPDAAASQKAA